VAVDDGGERGGEIGERINGVPLQCRKTGARSLLVEKTRLSCIARNGRRSGVPTCPVMWGGRGQRKKTSRPFAGRRSSRACEAVFGQTSRIETAVGCLGKGRTMALRAGVDPDGVFGTSLLSLPEGLS